MVEARARRSPRGQVSEHAGQVSIELEFLRARQAQAKATAQLAAAISTAVDRFGPAADTFHGFGERLDALCIFLQKKGPWFLASVPMILVAINAISPTAATGLAEALAKIAAALAP